MKSTNSFPIPQSIITREEALKISPAYVKYCEGDFNQWEVVQKEFVKVRKGMPVITFHSGHFVKGKISNVDHRSYQAVDGPVVRFTDGQYSWRVDGVKDAFPIPH